MPKAKKKTTTKAKSHPISIITSTNNDTNTETIPQESGATENVNDTTNVKTLIEQIPNHILCLLRGYGQQTAGKFPVFDNDMSKFSNWKNSLMHYLLVNGQHDHIDKTNISDSENLALYLAIANCLQGTSLNLIQSQAFLDGQKAYKLLCQKYLGNSDAREAKNMFNLAILNQGENEGIPSYVTRIEHIKHNLDEFGTIRNSNYFVIMALKGLNSKFHTLKTVINSDKIPDWEIFKERLESHGAMSNFDQKQSNQILNITNPSNVPNIYHNRNQSNYNRFHLDNTKCSNCFGPHKTYECRSVKYCNKCQNASHNQNECRYINQNGNYRGQGTSGYNTPPSRGGRGFNTHRGYGQRRGGRSNRGGLSNRGSTIGRGSVNNVEHNTPHIDQDLPFMDDKNNLSTYSDNKEIISDAYQTEKDNTKIKLNNMFI